MATNDPLDKKRWPGKLKSLVQQPGPVVAPLELPLAFRAGQAIRKAPGAALGAINQAAMDSSMAEANMYQATGRAVADDVVAPIARAGANLWAGLSGREVPPVSGRAPPREPGALSSAILSPPQAIAPRGAPFDGLATAAPVGAPVIAGPSPLARQRNAGSDPYPFDSASFPARGGRPAATVTGQQIESIGQRVNTVPSAAFTGAGGGSGQRLGLTFSPASSVGGGNRGNDSASRGIQARSAMLDQLYQQALGRVNSNSLLSYGDLFNRKRDMNTLAQLGPLVQAGGSNVVQAAGDVLNANTTMRGQDINREGNYLKADTSRYGIDRGYESNLGQQAVSREGNLLQADTSRYSTDKTFESNRGQQATTLKGYMLANEQAQATNAQKVEEFAQSNPDYMLQVEAAQGRTLEYVPDPKNPDAPPKPRWRKLTKEEHDASMAQWQAFSGKTPPLDFSRMGQ